MATMKHLSFYHSVSLLEQGFSMAVGSTSMAMCIVVWSFWLRVRCNCGYEYHGYGFDDYEFGYEITAMIFHPPYGFYFGVVGIGIMM